MSGSIRFGSNPVNLFCGKAKIVVREMDVIALVDPAIAEYYLNLIPKYLRVSPQRHPPHITVVRSPPKEVVVKRETWGYNEGKLIQFWYFPVVRFDGVYFFLDVFSEEIGQIREALGLPRFREGFSCYHLTIGNVKLELLKGDPSGG